MISYLDDYNCKLAVSLGDKKGYVALETIYFDLKIISNHKWFDYQIGNVFSNRGDNYLLESALPDNSYFSSATFLAKLIETDFIKKLEEQVPSYKKRERKNNT